LQQREELSRGGTVASKSFTVLVLVGIVEVIVGVFSGSVALVADGVHSFSDAAVSLIVWLGLRLSRRAADGRFHFGYYRVETFSSMVAAAVMAVLGTIILYESYLALQYSRQIVNAELAMIVALAATVIALIMSVFKRREARKFDSLALKADAFNSVKDFLTSFTAFIGVALSRYLDITQTDAIASIIIAFFVFTVSYYIIKEASLVLMDACSCSEIISDVENITKTVTHVKAVNDVRLRKIGPYVMGDMRVEVDGSITVNEADKIRAEIEEKVKQEFDEVAEIKVRIEPSRTRGKQEEEKKAATPKKRVS
jgi:cation diffusion facilitator family transporter